MKITVLGAGAMGMLFGGYLSKQNDVTLLDVDHARIEKIQKDGVVIREKDGSENVFYPKAVTDCDDLPEMDLILVFVKSMYTIAALSSNQSLIGPNTYLMTLQNGAGHDEKLLQFADSDHVIIASTQHNSSLIDNGHINHGGSGKTMVGLLGGSSGLLEPLAENFNACGLECETSADIKRQIWTKLFTNTAASSLTAVLQVPLGFIHSDPSARRLMEELAKEATAVANADCGGGFDAQKVIETVDTVCRNAPNGYTSIYADVKNGARSEVDTISGAVIEAASEYGIPVPYHEMVVKLIHALEHKNRT